MSLRRRIASKAKTIAFVVLSLAGGASAARDVHPITVNYSAVAIAHSEASFLANSNLNTLTLDFGEVNQSSDIASLNFGLTNLVSAAGFTAGLDLTGISSISGPFSTDFNAINNRATVSRGAFHAFLSTSTPGLFHQSVQIFVSDQRDLAGAIAGQVLTLNLTGRVVVVPEPAGSVVLFVLLTKPLLRTRRGIAGRAKMNSI